MCDTAAAAAHAVHLCLLVMLCPLYNGLLVTLQLLYAVSLYRLAAVHSEQQNHGVPACVSVCLPACLQWTVNNQIVALHVLHDCLLVLTKCCCTCFYCLPACSAL